MVRWVLAGMALGLGALGMAACDGDDTVTQTTGGAGRDGGGDGGDGGGCETGYVSIQCEKEETYVLLLPNCPTGTIPRDLLRCDACQCTAPCSMDGAIHDTSDCTSSGISFMDVQSCYNTANTGGDLYVAAAVTPGSCSPRGEPSLRACEIQEETPCPLTGACVPESLLPLVPLCIALEGDAPCRSGYENKILVQEGGTCGCACGAPSAACPAQVRLFSDDACTADETVIELGSVCNQVPSSTAISSISAPEGPPCDAAPPSPSGGKTMTLCCLSAP